MHQLTVEHGGIGYLRLLRGNEVAGDTLAEHFRLLHDLGHLYDEAVSGSVHSSPRNAVYHKLKAVFAGDIVYLTERRTGTDVHFAECGKYHLIADGFVALDVDSDHNSRKIERSGEHKHNSYDNAKASAPAYDLS